jgi:hypothetical protein
LQRNRFEEVKKFYEEANGSELVDPLQLRKPITENYQAIVPSILKDLAQNGKLQ